MATQACSTVARADALEWLPDEPRATPSGATGGEEQAASRTTRLATPARTTCFIQSLQGMATRASPGFLAGHDPPRRRYGNIADKVPRISRGHSRYPCTRKSPHEPVEETQMIELYFAPGACS